MPITHIDLDPEKIFKPKRRLSKVKIFLGSLFGFLIVIVVLTLSLFFYYYPKVKVLTADLATVGGGAESLQNAVESQDIIKAKKELTILRTNLENIEKDLGQFQLIGRLPVVDGYYADAEHALKAAVLSTKAGEVVADSLVPFGDILGLKGVKSDVEAEEKVEVLVTKVLPSLSPKANELEKIIKEIKKETDQISESRYPGNLMVKGQNVREGIVEIKNILTKAEYYLPAVKDALETLPSILGYQEEKSYLLLFQNDKELRATGGFLTAYAIAKIKNGKLLDIQSEDMYELDKRVTSFEPPPPLFKKYLFMQTFPIRDVNISPDFKVSAEKFESYYSRIPRLPKIDGIIAIDTEAVRKFLETTGPVKTKKYNETFSAEINKKYKIPDVVYKLELYAEKLMAGSDDRKGIIGDLMDSMLEKLLSAPPDKFSPIFETFLQAAEEKNIMFYMHNEKAQKLAEELNYAGRIRDFDMDYLHVNNSNLGGLKGNLYIKEQIEQDIVVTADGTVTKKVTVILKNTEKADGWLNGVYQNWMRVYAPSKSKLIEKKVATDFAEKYELGKRVWESFSKTYPLKSTETSFTYKLPFKLKKGDIYKLFIQKQPGTTDPLMIIRLNGRKIKEFDLKKDIEVEFKI